MRKLYDNLVSVGPVLERLQLYTDIHHGLHFRPILERQRVRIVIVGHGLLERAVRVYLRGRHVGQREQLLPHARNLGELGYLRLFRFLQLVRSRAILGQPHQLLPEHGGRVRGGRGYLGQRGKLLSHAELVYRLTTARIPMPERPRLERQVLYSKIFLRS